MPCELCRPLTPVWGTCIIHLREACIIHIRGACIIHLRGACIIHIRGACIVHLRGAYIVHLRLSFRSKYHNELTLDICLLKNCNRSLREVGSSSICFSFQKLAYTLAILALLTWRFVVRLQLRVLRQLCSSSSAQECGTANLFAILVLMKNAL